MSNFISAATRIRTVYISLIKGEESHRLAEYAARWLQDDGLLAPDLPEPNDPHVFVPDGKGWLPGGPHGPSIWTAPDSRIMVQRLEPGDLTPEEAREVAHALLAAANYSEEGNQE